MGNKLYLNKNNINGESFNFGPNFRKNYSVKELLNKIQNYIPNFKWELDNTKNKVHEAGLLNLDSRKSLKLLGWKNLLNFEQTVKMTSEWYLSYINNNDLEKLTKKQIHEYEKKILR